MIDSRKMNKHVSFIDLGLGAFNAFGRYCTRVGAGKEHVSYAVLDQKGIPKRST